MQLTAAWQSIFDFTYCQLDKLVTRFIFVLNFLRISENKILATIFFNKSLNFSATQ
jgi:hypothetical protein